MRFPLASSPFDALELSGSAKEECAELAKQTLDQALRDLLPPPAPPASATSNSQRHPRSFAGQVIKPNWKFVAKRENISVYKDVSSSPPSSSTTSSSSRTTLASSCSSSSSIGLCLKAIERSPASDLSSHLVASSNQKSLLPVLYGVGSIPGSLNDVMYGLVARDASSLRIKTSYVEDYVVDGRVLLEIPQQTDDQEPAEKPFDFLGIKWIVKATPRLFVKPRDFVVLNYSGITSWPSIDASSGDPPRRVGYFIMKSIDLPKCGSLQSKLGVCRAEVASVFLFYEQESSIGLSGYGARPHRQVHVMMRMLTDVGGHAPESLAVNSVAHGMISGCFQSVYCAQMKKLAWFVTQNSPGTIQQYNRQQEQEDGDDDEVKEQEDTVESFDEDDNNDDDEETASRPSWCDESGRLTKWSASSATSTPRSVDLDYLDYGFGALSTKSSSSTAARTLGRMGSSQNVNLLDVGSPVSSTARRGLDCWACQRPFHTFTSKHLCYLCQQEVCRRCSATKYLSYDTDKRVVRQKRFKFCKICLTKSNQVSCLWIARQEYHQRRRQQQLQQQQLQQQLQNRQFIGSHFSSKTDPSLASNSSYWSARSSTRSTKSRPSSVGVLSSVPL